MAEFPFLPFWTDAYLADTTHLRTEEHGAYLLLLMSAWRSADCSIPDDDDALSRIAGLSLAKWQSMKPTVMAFWKLEKRRKRWSQKRLKIEREKAAEKRVKAKDSALSGWNKRKSGNANAKRTQSYPEPQPEPFRKADAFPQGAPAREKPKNWVDKKSVSQALDTVIARISDYEHSRTEISGDALETPVQQLPAVRAG